MPTSRATATAVVLLLAALLVLLAATSVGSTGFAWPWAASAGSTEAQIVREIRLPRALGAWLAGALLGLAGAVAQGLFRNPLADPYLLGSASGAALGVAGALSLFGMSVTGTQWVTRLGLTGAAFVGAVAAVLLTLLLARGAQQTLRLLLAGVVVGVVLGAARDLISIASADLLQALQGFMLGSTALVGWGACAALAGTLALCLLAGWALAPVLDGLALGEATAASLGLPLPALRAALVAVLALATGAAVAQTGLIAFVGLAAPHLVRSIVRVTHARLLALSALMGGLLLAAADLLARAAIAPQELPVGVLTAVLGGGYLLWLMRRRNAPVPSGAMDSIAAPAQAVGPGARSGLEPAVLTGRGLRARRGGVPVLHGVDVAFAPGRWTSIVGPNGAGKSTLLAVLAGLRPQASPAGELRLDGQPLARLPARSRARRLAWLGQGGADDRAADDLAVYDVAMLGRLPHQRWLAAPSAADHAAVEAALRQTQAWEWRVRPFGQLSGGERQRVLLARALAVQAPVLLLDEPLASLDPPHQADCLAIARAQAAQGRTVVTVLHELQAALAADCLVVMTRGQVVHQGPSGDPATHRALEQVFGQRVQVLRVGARWTALPR